MSPAHWALLVVTMPAGDDNITTSFVSMLGTNADYPNPAVTRSGVLTAGDATMQSHNRCCCASGNQAVGAARHAAASAGLQATTCLLKAVPFSKQVDTCVLLLFADVHCLPSFTTDCVITQIMEGTLTCQAPLLAGTALCTLHSSDVGTPWKPWHS